MIYLLLIIPIYFILCYIIFLFVCKVNKNTTFRVIDDNIEVLLKPYKELMDYGTSWVKKQNIEDLYIKSVDGLKLHGIFIKNPNEKGIFILSHGYRSNKERDLFSALHEDYKLGLSLLILDSRCCGESEGKYITFGYYESKDINLWVNYVSKKFKPKKILIGGVSLGAASSLLVNNKKVSAILSDSPFESGYKEIKYCISHYFHLPGFIFMPGINLWCKLCAHFDLKKTDAHENLKKISVPILWVHGLDDDFVIPKNSINLYDSYEHKKDLFLVSGANHGMGYLLEPENYFIKVKSFLKNIL